MIKTSVMDFDVPYIKKELELIAKKTKVADASLNPTVACADALKYYEAKYHDFTAFRFEYDFIDLFCGGAGLPISCIANLCYLPEYVNRSKKDKNFYQDTKYLQHINLSEVERKYSFTTSDDLEWMDMPYEGQDDFDELKQFYTDFCTNRFATLKKLFCESMGIDYDAMMSIKDEVDMVEIVTTTTTTTTSSPTQAATMRFTAECVSRIENSIGNELVKLGRVIYKTADNSKGYVISSSKAYKQGSRNKYWYGYRRNPLEEIKDCAEKYLVYGCKDDNEVLCFPVDVMEERTGRMNYSLGDDGEVDHWHIVFFRDGTGHMTQLLSHPDLEEVDLDSFKI